MRFKLDENLPAELVAQIEYLAAAQPALRPRPARGGSWLAPRGPSRGSVRLRAADRRRRATRDGSGLSARRQLPPDERDCTCTGRLGRSARSGPLRRPEAGRRPRKRFPTSHARCAPTHLHREPTPEVELCDFESRVAGGAARMGEQRSGTESGVLAAGRPQQVAERLQPAVGVDHGQPAPGPCWWPGRRGAASVPVAHAPGAGRNGMRCPVPTPCVRYHRTRRPWRPRSRATRAAS